MLSIDSLKAKLVKRPDLAEAIDAFSEYLLSRPNTRTVDLRSLLVHLGGRLSVDEITELLHAMRETGAAKLVYRIKDPKGFYTAHRINSLRDRPEYDTDREGNSFEVELEDLTQTYELAE